MTRTTRFAVALVATAGGMLATRAARAQSSDAGVTYCSSLPNPIYVGGSSAFQPTMNLYAAALAKEGTTVIYFTSASCQGASAIANHTLITTGGAYYLSTGAASPSTCTADSNTYLDIGVSDVFYDSCATNNQAPSPEPANVHDALGPVQAMEIIVPQNNTTGYLTAAEGDVIWGCGKYNAAGVVFNMNGVFCRGTTSGSQIITAAGIGLSDQLFAGNGMMTSPMLQQSSSGNMGKAVGGYPTANQGSLNAIGFIGADVFDSNHAATPGNAFIALPFAASGQTKAYYVDSEPGLRDRRNVRDGHYFNWGYEHLLYSVPTTDAGAGQPSAGATKVINLVTGAATDPSFDYVQLDAVAGTVPLCAMSVAKANDSPGYLSVSTPSGGTCNCAYVAAASGNVPAGCTACTATDGGSSCASGQSCQHGYCE